jgi:hypothetical protein
MLSAPDLARLAAYPLDAYLDLDTGYSARATALATHVLRCSLAARGYETNIVFDAEPDENARDVEGLLTCNGVALVSVHQSPRTGCISVYPLARGAWPPPLARRLTDAEWLQLEGRDEFLQGIARRNVDAVAPCLPLALRATVKPSHKRKAQAVKWRDVVVEN